MDRRRALIVDDEPRNLSLLEAVLAPLDVDTARAEGGREGIALFERELVHGGFDLVLLDVMMPVVDGMTALAAMRAATPPGLRIPIVLVTALHARDDRVRGLEAGADDFLSKPLDAQEVRCRARTFLALSLAQRTLAARAAELERLQRDRAELSRMLVHDLKNPLAALGGNLSYIARKLVGADPVVLEAFEDSTASAERLLSLVGEMIDVDRAETGQLEAARAPLALRPFLEEVARRHKRQAELNGVQVVVDAETSGSFSLDERLTARALENLVENAIRYTGARGTISLAARATREGLQLSVSNTGRPIDASAQPTLFDKYATSERGGYNRGLGLYLCRLVAEAHGGTIAIESDATWPTRFVLRVPSAKPALGRRRTGPFAEDSHA